MNAFDKKVLHALAMLRPGPTAREIAAFVLSLRPVRWYHRFIPYELRLSYGRIYASLMKLEQQGIITGDFIPGPFPRRRVYAVTQRQMLREMAARADGQS